MAVVWDAIALPLAIAFWVFTWVIFPCTPLLHLVTTAKFRRDFNSYKRLYFSLTLILNFAVLAFVLHTTRGYDLNDIFLSTVHLLALALRKIDDLLESLLSILLIFMLWKFKDRLLLALGVERPGQLLGDFRDWLTCWGMQRFEPLELHFLKLENAHVGKSVFLNVTMGYNLDHTTRVRTHVNPSNDPPEMRNTGFTLDLRETIQINYDPMEITEVMTIELRQQTIYKSEVLSRCQIGAAQLQKMVERERANSGNNPVLNPFYQTSRTGTVSHNTTRLLFDQDGGSNSSWEKVNLVPSGVLYFRCIPVREGVLNEDEGLGTIAEDV